MSSFSPSSLGEALMKKVDGRHGETPNLLATSECSRPRIHRKPPTTLWRKKCGSDNLRSTLLAIGMTLSMTFFVAQAFADPYLESDQLDLEGGLTVLNLFVNGDDGLSIAFFVDLTFTSTEFNEVLGGMGVDITSSDHFLWDNDPDYVASRSFDSFFYTRLSDSWTAQPPCDALNGVDHSPSGSYQVCLGTRAGEGSPRLALGQLVVPTGETVFFEGKIFRSASTFAQSGAIATVPEPTTAVLLGGGLLLLAGRRRRAERLQ